MGDIFKRASQHNLITKTSLPKLNQALRNTNYEHNKLSCKVPTIWNKLQIP